MSQKLGNKEVLEILESYAEFESVNKVADNVDYARSTCERYIRRAKTNELDDEYELPEDLELYYQQYHEDDVEEDPLIDPKDEVADLLENFFEEVGEKSSLRAPTMNFLVVEETREHGVIPTPTELLQEILSGTTGVDNQTVASRIVSRYERLIKNNPTIQRNLQRGDVSLGAGNAGLQQGGAQQTWGGHMGGMQQMGQPMSSGQHQGPMGAMNNPMMMMFQQMQQQMEDMREEIRRSRADPSDSTLEEKTQEFLERRLEQLIEADTTEEQEIIVEQLRGLRHDIQQGAAGRQVELGEDWRTDLIELARAGNIEFSEAKEILESVGEVETDPRVMEKKYDKDIEEMRLDHETERYERLGGLFETAIENAGRAMGEAIVSGGDGDASDSDESDEEGTEVPTSPPSPEEPPAADGGQTMQVSSEPADSITCEHCGETMQQAPNGTHCLSCEFGYGRCDHCDEPVTIPPLGEAPFRWCPECSNDPAVEALEEIAIDAEGPPEAERACDRCEWEGTIADLMGEAIQCEACTEFLPIQRLNPVVSMAGAALED